MIRGELFFFKSGYVWRIRDGHLESGYPALASRHWRGIPSSIDAAFEDKSGNIWFFQGEQGGPAALSCRLGFHREVSRAAGRVQTGLMKLQLGNYWNAVQCLCFGGFGLMFWNKNIGLFHPNAENDRRYRDVLWCVRSYSYLSPEMLEEGT